MNHYWRAAVELLHGLRDAFPDEHPSLTLDRETRTVLVIVLNPKPGEVLCFKLDEADLSRFPADVIVDIKAMRAQAAA